MIATLPVILAKLSALGVGLGIQGHDRREGSASVRRLTYAAAVHSSTFESGKEKTNIPSSAASRCHECYSPVSIRLGRYSDLPRVTSLLLQPARSLRSQSGPSSRFVFCRVAEGLYGLAELRGNDGKWSTWWNSRRRRQWKSASGNGVHPPRYAISAIEGLIAENLLPGVMRFLQTEWHRHERDRNAWQIERAEMKSRIGKLEGDSRTSKRLQESLGKHVKILENALKREREKIKSIQADPKGEVKVDEAEVPKEPSKVDLMCMILHEPHFHTCADVDRSKTSKVAKLVPRTGKRGSVNFRSKARFGKRQVPDILTQIHTRSYISRCAYDKFTAAVYRGARTGAFESSTP